jgi:steroid delta-isomerase-like uncharacterized protein
MTPRSVTEHEQLVRDYVELWTGDLSKMDVVAESVTGYDPAHPDGEVHGRDEFEEFIRHTHAAFPDFTLRKDTEGMLATDDTVMLEWTAEGTHRGDFYGVPPTGRKMSIDGMAKTTIVDRNIEEDRIYFDQKEMLDQFGFTFPDVVFLAPKLVAEKIRGAV